MKKTRLLALLYLLSLLLLVASGSLSGALSQAVYILSFISPVALGIYIIQKERGEDFESLLSLDSRSLGLLLPTIAPIVLVVILTSLLTSFLIEVIFGAQNDVHLGENLLIAILSHAIMPAFLEEALYRYLPMRLWGKERDATLVVISSLFFALVHRDFFVIPYAFLAGALFMIMDILTDSIWPSVILHAVNNTLSVVWIFYSESTNFVIAFHLSLAILSIVSLIFVFRKRREYLAGIKKIFCGERLVLGGEIWYLAVPTLILAAINLAAKI